MNDFIVTGHYICHRLGRRPQPVGTRLQLTEQEARYSLLDGTIEPAKPEIERARAKKPDSEA